MDKEFQIGLGYLLLSIFLHNGILFLVECDALASITSPLLTVIVKVLQLCGLHGHRVKILLIDAKKTAQLPCIFFSVLYINKCIFQRMKYSKESSILNESYCQPTYAMSNYSCVCLMFNFALTMGVLHQGLDKHHIQVRYALT